MEKPIKNQTNILNLNKESLFNSSIFLSAVIFYTIIMALGGFLEPVYGLAGLCLIAVISILKILFKNFLLIVGMIVFGLVCTAVPFLLVIYIPILIFFFFARLGYFVEHWRLVLTGLIVYFLPVFILLQAMKSPSILIFLIAPTILFPLAIHYFYKNYDYTVGKILELFSEAPILIVSILLPFLKLGLSVGDVPVAMNSHAIPDGYPLQPEALTVKPVATPVTEVTMNLGQVAIDPVTPVILSNNINPNFNLDSFYQTLSHSHQLFDQTGNESIMSFGDKVQIGLGADHIVLIKEGFHVNVLNSEGHQIGTIENNLSNLGTLEIKNSYGVKMGEIEFSQDQNTIMFKDVDNFVVASVDQSIQSDLSKSFIQAELDKSQAALNQLEKGQTPIDQLEKEQISENQIDYANNISFAILSILAMAKKEKNIDTAQLEIDGENSRPILLKDSENEYNIFKREVTFFKKTKYKIFIYLIIFLLVIAFAIFHNKKKSEESYSTSSSSFYHNSNDYKNEAMDYGDKVETTSHEFISNQMESNEEINDEMLNENSYNIFDGNVEHDDISVSPSSEEVLRQCFRNPPKVKEIYKESNPCNEGTDCWYAWEYEQSCGFVLDNYYPNCFFDVDSSVNISCLKSGEIVSRDKENWDPNLKSLPKTVLIKLSN